MMTGVEEVKKSLKKDLEGIIVPLISGVFVEGGEVLMLKRSPKSKYSPNAWQFPEGKMKFGETTVETLKREVNEELNASFSKPELFDVSTGTIEVKGLKIHIIRIAYKAVLNEKKFKLSDENSEYKWVGLKEARRMHLVVGALDLIEKTLSNK